MRRLVEECSDACLKFGINVVHKGTGRDALMQRTTAVTIQLFIKASHVDIRIEQQISIVEWQSAIGQRVGTRQNGCGDWDRFVTVTVRQVLVNGKQWFRFIKISITVERQSFIGNDFFVIDACGRLLVSDWSFSAQEPRHGDYGQHTYHMKAHNEVQVHV